MISAPPKKIFGTHLALCPGPKGAQNPLATGPRLVFLRGQHVQLGLYWLGLHVLSEQQLPRFGSNMFNHCQAIFPDFPDFGKLLIAYHIYPYCVYIYTSNLSNLCKQTIVSEPQPKSSTISTKALDPSGSRARDHRCPENRQQKGQFIDLLAMHMSMCAYPHVHDYIICLVHTCASASWCVDIYHSDFTDGTWMSSFSESRSSAQIFLKLNMLNAHIIHYPCVTSGV